MKDLNMGLLSVVNAGYFQTPAWRTTEMLEAYQGVCAKHI